MNKIIDKYIDELQQLRKDPLKLSSYSFILDPLTHEDINQEKRYLLGVGLFNDLHIDKDYELVRSLLDEEIKQRNAGTANYNKDVIHMYFYFLSQFKNINDIWTFAEFKYGGTFKDEFSFDTGFFLVYGKEKLKTYLKKSDHRLKEKVYQSVFGHAKYSNIDGIFYQKTQIRYFGFKIPIPNPLEFYQTLKEWDLYAMEYQKWTEDNDITDPQIAYDNIQYAGFLKDDRKREEAILNYYFSVPDGWLANEYLKELSPKTKFLIFLKNLRKNMTNRKYIASTLMNSPS